MTAKTLGNYEILDQLGEGGMGQVWRARDQRLQRYVAIEILPEAASGESARTLPVVIVDIVSGQRTPWKEIKPAQPVLEANHLHIAPNGAYAYNVVLGTSDLYVAAGLK